MPVSVKVAGLLLLVAVSFPSQTDAQLQDSSGGSRPIVAPDSTIPIDSGTAVDTTIRIEPTVRVDSASAADTADVTPLGGIGSLARSGLPIRTLPERELSYLPFRSGGDIIPHFGSMFVSETGLGGVRRKYSVHGLADGSMAFLSDGAPLNNPSTGLYLTDLYPVDFAESIEYVPTPGGAVNFVSRSARAPRPVSRIRYTQSSYGSSILDGEARCVSK